MGISYNPSIVTEGLVLGLDPQSPRFYNYKGRSVAFDGTGDYLSIGLSSDFQLSNLDFTIEFWLNWTSFPGVIADLVSTRPNSSAAAGFLVYANSTHIVLALSSNGSTWDFNTGPSVTWSTGNWIHCSVTRQGSDIRFFINGTQQGSGYTYSNSINVSNPLVIGGSTDGYTLNGYISNLRILKGTALYTSNFTPPTEPLTAVTNTKLLTCQGNTISDASSSAHSITPNGNAVIDYNGPFSGSGWTDLTNRGNSGTLTNGPVFIPGGPFNNSGGSVYFDGTGDYLNFTNINNGTDDFTYEAWVYPTESGKDNPAFIYTSSLIHIAGLYNTAGGTNAIFGASSRPGSGNYVLYAPDITLNTWHHIAWVKSGSSLKIYVDGVNQTLTDTGSFSGTQSNNVSYIGTTVSNEYFEGYISNARVIGGTALYTANFTPPTGPLEAVDDTVLLTCQGGAITDNGPNSHAITVNNDAEAITASAFEFDGTDDRVAVSSIPLMSQVTVEWWGTSDYPTSGYRVPVIATSGGSWTDGFGFYQYDGYVSWFVNTYTKYARISATSFGFTHWVGTYDLNNIKLYRNGSLVNTNAYTNAMNHSSSTLQIASQGSSYLWDGKISNVKIYNKALTEDEVKRNFSALRGRYGI